MLICGVDESGKGPVLGPLMVAAVVFNDKVLKKLPVKDSKALSAKRRTIFDAEITKTAHEIVIVELTAEDINGYHREGINLNEMEVIAFTHALNELESKPDEVWMDAADVIEARFRDNVISNYKWADDVPVVAEHKADQNHPIVSAASIVAKVARDKAIQPLGAGSGYPGDKKTIQWLREYYAKYDKWPPEARYFWKTLDKIKNG